MENKDQLLDSERIEIENNKWVKNSKVDHKFVFNHYGECSGFLNEILQTEGIVPEEHEVLTKVSMKRTKWETRGGHWLGILYGLFHLRMVFRTNKTIIKLFVAVAYPLFCFDASYDIGRIIGNFIVMPYNLNTILNLRNGNSIHALQTRLFLKRCVYEDIFLKNNKKSSKGWNNSYVVNKVLGKSVGRVREVEAFVYKFLGKS